MPTTGSAQPAGQLRWLAIAAGAAALVTGAGHAAAWMTGLMAHVPSRTIVMKANAGLGLFAAGLAVILVARREPRRIERRGAQLLAAFVLVLGLATLLEHVLGWNLHIDQVLARESAGAASTTSPNRMGPPGALSFVLFGTALLLALRPRRRRALHEPFTLVVALLALLSVVGYLYNASELYAVAKLTAIAWPTALSFLALAIGLLCARPGEGLMAHVTADDAGGDVVRAVLGPVVFLPIVFGWFRLAGERFAWFDAPMGTAAMMVLFIVTFAALLLYAGRRVGLAAAALSRSERALRQSEQALRESEQFLSFALTTARTGAWDLDLVDHSARRSIEHDRIFGYEGPLAAWTYEQFLEHVLPEDRERVDSAFRTAVGERRDWSFECRIRRRDGQTRWIWAAGRHRPDERGVPRRMAGVVQDITERKQAAEALAERAAELEAVLDSLQDGVFVYDAAGNVIRTNPAARQLYGMDLTGDRLVEHATLDLRIRRPDGSGMPPSEFPSRRALAGEHVGREQYLFAARDGTDRVGEVSATPLVVNGRIAGAVAIARDITERKHIEENLRRSEEKFAKAFHANASAAAITRLEDGRYIEVNDRFVDVTGFSREETIGRTTTDLNIWQDPGDREAFVREIREHGVVRNLECRFRRPTGETWIALVSSQIGEIEGRAVLISSFADITEGKRAERALRASEEALREANARLAEADRRKDEFLAVLSHELRNPLAPVRSALYLLEHAAPGGDQANRARTVIDRQVTQLTRLVDDLLDVTRITRGKIHLRREPIELTALVARTAEDHRDLFAARGVDFQVDISGEPLWVDGDAPRLAQVVGNLLQNAAKFTERGGSTAVRLTSDSGTAIVSVRDTGLGISANAITRLFEPFMQVDATLDRARGGLGLGLSLVKSLTEMHGGTVSARSDGLGQGTEFIVRLPLRSAPEMLSSVAPRGGHSSRRILIIEDNLDAANSLREALAIAGHEVETAFSGPDGIARAREFAPEVVLCDIGLPGMSGYDVARAVRSDDALASVYLIALTGYALPDDVAKAREAGFDLHIPKPPDPATLQRALNEVRRGRPD